MKAEPVYAVASKRLHVEGQEWNDHEQPQHVYEGGRHESE